MVLRIHDWNGTVLKEESIHAAAAYGHLVIGSNTISLSISSGQEAPRELYISGNPGYGHIIADRVPVSPLEMQDLTGDRIVVWKADSGRLFVVPIPQDDGAPLMVVPRF